MVLIQRLFHTFRQFLTRALRLLFPLLVILFLLPASTVNLNDPWLAIAYIISDDYFDYIGWELEAISAKASQTLYGQHPFMTETDRSAYVREYMADIARAQQLEADINRIYSDPDIADPEATSAELRDERDTLRADLRQRQNLAEAILEGQVAAVLVEQGFGLGGQLLPPMAMRFTRMPNLLVTSPRDEIRMETSLNVQPMPVDDIEELEANIEARFDNSALVVPLGGMALYPAMILETSSIPWAVETFAHEWLHHYLFFYPLGISYFTDLAGFAGEARTINETTADLFGREVGRIVLARYYPDLLPPEPPPQPEAPGPQQVEPEPPAFDFGAEMNETRVQVDALLAEGRVDEAEAYMDERRRFFAENGYRIRKLNQAYFAFYGGYQGGGIPGIGGTDPVGPAVQSIRERSESLVDFVEQLRGVTTREHLLACEAHRQVC